MKKKALAILLSILMLTSVTLPGTWATDETEPTEDTVVVVSDEAETDAPEPEPETETDAPEVPEDTNVPEDTDAPESETETEETESETDAPESETETEETESESTEPEPEEETFDPYAAIEYMYTLGSNEEIVAYLQSLSEDELSAVQAILEEWGMWADIAAMLYPEESPEGLPPEDWGSTSLEGAVPFTNAVSMFSLVPRESGSNNGDPGVVLNKTATANDNGGFDITLEAYATGEQTTESAADVVLVLDTSGSMKYGMTDEDYETVYIESNTDYKEYDRKYILQDGEYVDVVLDQSKKYWRTVRSNNSYGNEFVPKRNQNDTNESYVFIVDGIDTSKTYYLKWKEGTDTTYEAVTYNNSQSAWVRERTNQIVYPKTNYVNSSESGYYYFYQLQENTQFYDVIPGKSRMDSLKTSVNNFIDSALVASPNIQIAIVSFSGKIDNEEQNPPVANADCVQEFTSDKSNLRSAVSSLSASGATYANRGMELAVQLLEADNIKDNGHKKFVIMFTDGAPSETTAFSSSVADGAIYASRTMKQNKVTVYTIGIFTNANGAVPTTINAFNSLSNENKYMHLVSSNYPNATSMLEAGYQNSSLNGKSYYLSASNATELNNIFQNISQVVGGATNSTLDTSTVVKDIIAPSFTVPANASDIKLYTANCTGAGLTFGDRTPATGVTATITGDTLDVTGFDFSANWCGSHSGTYGGQKLIIEFTVSPKPGFLGGNDVPTNGNTSGMYLNGSQVALFEVPQVNVEIKPITITAADKNVYLTQVPGETDLKSGVTIKCGDVDITDPSKLEDWQKAYVNIGDWTVTTGTDFDATVDGSYTVSAKVSPKTEGDSSKPGTVATAKTNSATGNINVFKPELTFRDSTVYYGDNAPTSYDSNKVGDAVWKHGETVSTDTGVTVIGTAPTLDMTYTPGAGIVGGKIATKNDIPVDVTVKIGDTDVTANTAFEHIDCTGKTCGKPDNGAFWLHVNTCSLTITKAAGTNTTIGNDEYFVFNVKKDNQPYTQVTIQGTGSVTISELPVGNYTVEEDAATAWRYSERSITGSGNLMATNPTGSFTCTNGNKDDHWLNFFNRVTNIFGDKNAVTDRKIG